MTSCRGRVQWSGTRVCDDTRTGGDGTKGTALADSEGTALIDRDGTNGTARAERDAETISGCGI